MCAISRSQKDPSPRLDRREGGELYQVEVGDMDILAVKAKIHPLEITADGSC
jgi:hypothetical protein